MAQNRTNNSSFNEMNTLSSVETIVFPNDNETLEHIFENVCDEIREFCNKINKQVRRNSRPVSVVSNTEKTVIMPEMSTLLENKTSILNKLTTLIKDSKANDFPHYRAEVTLSIPEMMKEETDSCQKAAELYKKSYAQEEENIKSLLAMENFLNEIEETSTEEDTSNELLQKISLQINKDFKECKSDMKTILEKLFPDDSNFKEVLGDLVTMDKEWYDVNDPRSVHAVTTLVNYGVAVYNPENPKQVKLII